MTHTAGSPIQIMPAQPGTSAIIYVDDTSTILPVIGWAVVARWLNEGDAAEDTIADSETDISPFVLDHYGCPSVIELAVADLTPVRSEGEPPARTRWEVRLP